MNLIKRYGLTTYTGTNAVAVLLAVMEYSKSFNIETQKWLTPLLWTLLILVFLAIRGNTPPEIAKEIMVERDLKNVLQEAREDD
jgi:hypothetical protein